MPSLAEILAGRDLVLPFSGVGHFRKEVVFVGLAPGQHRDTLEKLAGESNHMSHIVFESFLSPQFYIIFHVCAW